MYNLCVLAFYFPDFTILPLYLYFRDGKINKKY